MGHFKTLLLRQFLPDQFQIISAITLGGPSQNLLLRILNFAFIDFFKKTLNFYHWFTMGNFKTLLFWQFLPDQFQIISATTLGGPSQKLSKGILIFCFIDF